MGFPSKRGLGLRLAVLLLVSMSAAADTANETPGIEVLVYESSLTSPSVLQQAEVEAHRIFRRAGIEIVWVNCSIASRLAVEACHSVAGPDKFVLRLVSAIGSPDDIVFGVAFVGQDGNGKYSDIFLDRVENAHRQLGVSLSRMLGTVAAHELGHLLLGSHAHSVLGIMAPQWDQGRLRQMDMGNLLFTSEQASRMKARIRGWQTARTSPFLGDSPHPNLQAAGVFGRQAE